MAKLLIGVIIGAILGGALTFWAFVGVPRSAKAPGTLMQQPDPNGVPAGTAQLTLRRNFFNDVLLTMFQEMSPPSFVLVPDHQSLPRTIAMEL